MRHPAPKLRRIDHFWENDEFGTAALGDRCKIPNFGNFGVEIAGCAGNLGGALS